MKKNVTFDAAPMRTWNEREEKQYKNVLWIEERRRHLKRTQYVFSADVFGFLLVPH